MFFSGVYTALVTPFATDGSVDYSKLKELVEFNIAGGVSGLVPVGTTGESPTLRTDEHLQVIKTVTETASGRVKIMAGTGANSTAEAIELTAAAREFGVDGTLQVTPYYNKPNSAGLIQHFSAVADIGVPVVLYNVPGRSALEIPLEVVVELAKHEHIVSVKEAAGSVQRVTDIKKLCDIEVLSGDDSLALPMIKEGALGVISVASNIMPAEVSALVSAALDGNYEEAQALHDQYAKAFDDLFIDTNPIPIKAAMAMKGLIEETYRLPMCATTDENKAVLRATLEAAGVL
ncbi:4-hydroxy-tetrahydrodipicolinate synthase [Pontiella agarivorans]|uniref:4-hydroxy-tetrahydrodipicolinate synthase n=1 Tax=Pontiella agarivorans TaxID=3038953 RepID=A0ABU5MYZ1_9BACT|nr:4-hydroxy-tetrahydrodipicolinate synthase [Pontiella agarivorans]MDZ8119421.1 4-hydroxy-tetrahydrodipicolinate synthase [Pontiella agarivorans]